ncbi:MAG: AzlD domain-containing protein [Lachnospiraceae bacterium]|nr:AzlD domain-containing protein [Lachnospiraceae bacterium]
MDMLIFMKYLVIMAGVTYLIRVIPFILVRKEITNERFKMFLNYVPYTVLSAMTIPAIFTATKSIVSAVIGTAVAVVLGYLNKSLLAVAAISCIVVFVVEYIMKLVGVL